MSEHAIREYLKTMKAGGGVPTPSELIDIVYPAGSYYYTDNSSFNPNVDWGGTWERLPEGYVLLSGSVEGDYGDYVVGNEYGSNTHTLTVNEMPSHAHPSFQDYNMDNPATGSAGGYIIPHWVAVSGAKGRIMSNYVAPYRNEGGGQAHSIMQRSIAVYVWHRIA